MATAIPGIMINSIRGKIGNVVFYTRRGRQCVRIHVIPRNPDTEAQRAVRSIFRDAVISWQAMSEDERYTFNHKARYLNMSGYNFYISNYIKRIIQTVSHTQTDELKSKIPSFTWNLELSTFNLLSVPELVEGLPSVSESYIRGSRIIALSGHLKPSPG